MKCYRISYLSCVSYATVAYRSQFEAKDIVLALLFHPRTSFLPHTATFFRHISTFIGQRNPGREFIVLFLSLIDFHRIAFFQNLIRNYTKI